MLIWIPGRSRFDSSSGGFDSFFTSFVHGRVERRDHATHFRSQVSATRVVPGYLDGILPACIGNGPFDTRGGMTATVSRRPYSVRPDPISPARSNRSCSMSAMWFHRQLRHVGEGTHLRSPPGSDGAMPHAPASNGCSQPRKPAPKWTVPILSPLPYPSLKPKSHNHCAAVLDRVEPGRRRWRWNPERRTVVTTLIVPPAPGARRSRARRRQMSRKIRCPQFLPSVWTCSSSNHSYASAQSQPTGSSARRGWFGDGRRRLMGVLSGP